MRRALVTITLALVLLPASAQAAFHLWKVKEVYSNADGSVQYIELFTSSSGQQFLTGHTITATSDGVVRVFTFPADSGAPTTSKHLLIATPGFAALPGAVTPDFTLPCGPFFTPTATSITIDFAGFDAISFGSATLPIDGTNSLTDSDLGAGMSLSSGPSSPTNFAGAAGAMALTGCLAAGTCEPCDDGMFCNGVEACAASACVPGPTCPVLCDETTDTCLECFTPADCDDLNPCSDDDCVTGGMCTHTPNSEPCDDGLFCTLTDMCLSLMCVGTGEACPGENCNEGTDACDECLGAGDCDDGFFCTGVEGCTGGSCTPGTNPCAVTEVCGEDTDVCAPLCGDGVVGPSECDDGNQTGGDGCSDTCTVEPGYACDGEPSVCTVLAPDAAPPDGAPDASPPDMSSTDAAATVDAPGGVEDDDGGCGCRTTAPRRNAASLLLVLGTWLVLRAGRRRRRG